MKRLITILALTTFAAVPAHALTVIQVYNEVAGMYCSGNSCTSDADDTATIENPDTSAEVLDQAATSEGPGSDGDHKIGCLTETIFGNPIPEDRLAFFCTGNNSLSPLTGGTPARFVTVVTDGGTSIVDICVTTTKVIGHTGHNPFTGWSIDSSTASSDGAC